MVLYVDGKRIGTNTGTTVGQSYTGYWRVGGDSPWSGNGYFAGAIDEVAIYPTVLTSAQVRAHYTAQRPDAPRRPGADRRVRHAVYRLGPRRLLRLDDTAGPPRSTPRATATTASTAAATTLRVADPGHRQHRHGA